MSPEMFPLPPEMAPVPGPGHSFGVQYSREPGRAEYHGADTTKPLAAAGQTNPSKLPPHVPPCLRCRHSKSSKGIRTPAGAPASSWGNGAAHIPLSKQEENCEPRDQHHSSIRVDTFIASHVAIHVILPKALTFVPAAWLARKSDQIYLEQLLGEVSASVESLQVANEVRAGHSLPNVLGEPGGEKCGGYLWVRD